MHRDPDAAMQLTGEAGSECSSRAFPALSTGVRPRRRGDSSTSARRSRRSRGMQRRTLSARVEGGLRCSRCPRTCRWSPRRSALPSPPGSPMTSSTASSTRTGRLRWIHDRGRPGRDPSDRVTWIDGVLFDVTEQEAGGAAQVESGPRWSRSWTPFPITPTSRMPSRRGPPCVRACPPRSVRDRWLHRTAIGSRLRRPGSPPSMPAGTSSGHSARRPMSPGAARSRPPSATARSGCGRSPTPRSTRS